MSNNNKVLSIKEDQAFNLRLPISLYAQLKNEKNRRSHMSINAIIVEAIISDLSSHNSGQAKELEASIEAMR